MTAAMMHSTALPVPKVSIITVVYNGGEAFVRTLTAVRRLTYPAIEYIVIDGGSTDGTLNVIRGEENLIARWLSEPDRGIYDAMNKGVSLATGEYLWFLNAGDTPAAPDVLNVVMKLPDKDYYFGDTRLVNEKGRPVGVSRSPSKLTWKVMTHGMKVSHQSFIGRRRLAPPFDLSYRYIADQKWIIEILKKSANGCKIDGALSNYLLGGISRRHYLKCVREKILYSFKELRKGRAIWVSALDLIKATKTYLSMILRFRSIP